MYEPLIFLLAIEVMGLFAFPIVFGLFSRLPDRGAMLAKPLVLLLCAYLWWMLGHIDGVAGSRATVLAIVGVLGSLFVFLLRRHGDEIIPFVRSQLARAAGWRSRVPWWPTGFGWPSWPNRQP